jgi:hypothetical protein
MTKLRIFIRQHLFRNQLASCRNCNRLMLKAVVIKTEDEILVEYRRNEEENEIAGTGESS